MKMYGEKSNWYSGPGFKFVDRYVRDLPGVERLSVYTRPSNTSSFLEGRKLLFQTRFTDAEYWRIMQFEFLEGSPYSADDDIGSNRVAVISDATRRRLFADGLALGETIELDAVEYRVIGVVREAPWYRVNSSGDIWLPLHTQGAAGFFDRLMGGVEVAFLLAPGADRKQ
jgi:putative ABC transport system permease protein